MERGLYIAAAGMTAEMARQDQIANELANAATPGYKADRVSQQSFADLGDMRGCGNRRVRSIDGRSNSADRQSIVAF